MLRGISISIILFSFCFGPLHLSAQDTTCLTVADLTQLSQEALDQATLQSCNPQQMILLLGAAHHLLQDTAFELQVRGDVCFSLVADELQRRGKKKNFDPTEPNIAFLLDQLATQQYHLALTRPSDWEKLWHYLETGEYSYVAKRFVDRGGVSYLLLLLAAFFLGWVYFKKYRRSKSESL